MKSSLMYNVMGIGFITAGFSALVVVSLGSAWGVLEALNTDSRVYFMLVYIIESLPAFFIVVFTSGYLTSMLNLMVIYTIIILHSLYFLGRLVSDGKVMNEYEYGKVWQAIYWAMSGAIAVGGFFGIISFLG